MAPGYLPAVYSTIRKAGGLCIADEVQSGFARIGSHFWGFEGHGVVPDIVTMAKVESSSVNSDRHLHEHFVIITTSTYIQFHIFCW